MFYKIRGLKNIILDWVFVLLPHYEKITFYSTQNFLNLSPGIGDMLISIQNWKPYIDQKKRYPKKKNYMWIIT